MDDSFYLTLPSNVSGGGNNTTAKFRTLLPNNIELSGSWYVALTEIQFPFSWCNAGVGKDDTEILMKFNRNDKTKVVAVKVLRNYYHTVEELVGYLQRKIKETLIDAMFDLDSVETKLNFKSKQTSQYMQGKYAEMGIADVVKIRYDKKDKRVRIDLDPLEVVPKITIPSKLQYLLGFSSNEREMFIAKKLNVAPYPPDMTGGVSAMYVYCDAVAPQIVGNSMSPLLRVVTLNTNRYKYGCTITKTFTDPHYIPVVAKSLHSILIQLNTDQDEPLSFNFGKSIIKLHFKRRR